MQTFKGSPSYANYQPVVLKPFSYAFKCLLQADNMVQLTTNFTKILMSYGMPRYILKITRRLFSNAQVLQRMYKYLMHVSSAYE